MRVELTFEAVQHVVGRREAGLGRDLGSADGAVTRATQKDHRPLSAHGCRRDLVLQFGRGSSRCAARSDVFHSM